MALGSRHNPARVFGRGAWIGPSVVSALAVVICVSWLLDRAGAVPQEEWDLQVPDRPATHFRPYSGIPLFFRVSMAYFAGQDSIVAYSVTPAGAGPLNNSS